jgi:16S rRNA (guanine(966)-N(2))-methyltransferase RsmD
MSVRIIAGSCKGRRLSVPSTRGLRPTGDRARESLFSVLAPGLPGASFLDAFAGCGAVGIEALSRGAEHVVFVEQDRRAAQTLAENTAHCGVERSAEILRASWKAACRVLARRGARFDVAFFDPPYDWAQAGTLLEDLESGALLLPGGFAVIEHRSISAPVTPEGWELRRVLRVGDTSFSFFGILTNS